MALKFKGFKLNDSQKILVTRGEKDPDEFVSSIESIDPGAITITYPIRRNDEPMELSRGERVYVKIPLGNFVIEFKSRVKGYRPDNILLVNLEHPVDYKRIQRRSSVRLKLLLDIQVAVPPEDPRKEPVFAKATALDISAGGMEAMVSSPYEKDTDLLVKFDLAVDKKTVHRFNLISRIRRVVPVPPNKFKIGFEFLELSRNDTDKIFQYIFKKSAEKNLWRK